MSFGSRLRDKRKALGITQPQLAKMLNVSQSAIGSWETDVNSPRATLLYDLFDILHCDANYLFQDETRKLYEDSASPEEFENIIKKYRKLDAHGEEIVNFILDKEYNRSVEAQTHPATIIEFQPKPDDQGHLAEYFRSASAGSGVFILGNEAAAKILVSESDWDARADFVISVAGDSMLPDYCDGDKVLVSQRTEMRHGDVGIFVVNGNVYIKEYGTDELISRNPDSPNIKIAEYDNIVCMGKVIRKIKRPFQIIED